MSDAVNLQVALVSNSQDDLHCLQAAYLMILQYFKPDYDVGWEEWSSLTGFEDNKGSWQLAGLLWFNTHGFEAKHISLFNMHRFATIGAAYLIEEYGEEVGQWQIEHSNLPLEQTRAKELIQSELFEKAEPTIEMIKQYLSQGYLIRCLVNSRKLNGKAGYFGHAVVVSGYDDEHLIIQDPGLPAIADRSISLEDFESAWADPNKEAKEMDIIRLRS